jgi:hypothetical protein
MADDIDDDVNEYDGDHGNGYTEPTADPVLIAVTWCRVANNKTLERAIKKLDRLNRQYADIQAKCAALTAHAEQTKAALDVRAAELDAQQAANIRHEDEFQSSIEDAHNALRQYHNYLEQMHRALAHRLLSLNGIAWNEDLQSPPSWTQLQQMLPSLPDDVPPPEREVAVPRIDALSDTFSDPSGDRHGHAFLGTLTRSTSHKPTSQ